MSEKNSCVLNVWTTDTKASKPVMLWIHGGGFDSGSAAGNPNVKDLPAWQPYTPENGECFIFDYECRVRNNFDRPLQNILNDCCFRQLDAFNRRAGR